MPSYFCQFFGLPCRPWALSTSSERAVGAFVSAVAGEEGF